MCFGKGVTLGFSGGFKLESAGKALHPAQRGRLDSPASSKIQRYTQPGRLLSAWLSAGYHSLCWRATSRNREPSCKECCDTIKGHFNGCAC